MACMGGLGCPQIYEAREITPKEMECCVGPCPAIYDARKEIYLIVGKVVSPADAGLEGKVGDGEALVEVSKALIDNKRK